MFSSIEGWFSEAASTNRVCCGNLTPLSYTVVNDLIYRFCKVWEIVSSGRLRRLEHIDQEKEEAIKMMQKIHGVGQVTAQQFYAQVMLSSHWLIRACNVSTGGGGEGKDGTREEERG